MRTEAVIVTGASTGIGRATVEELHRRGHTVVATARKPEALDDLPCDIHKLRLDVCDSVSVSEAVAEAEDLTGGLTALVNNAGYPETGPIELVTEDAVRLQLDTNVEGPLRMIREVLPGFRRRRAGTIVNMSSIAGNISAPFFGVYSASKHALEAISDSLRVEVRPFGVRVAVIEPGAVHTHFWDLAREHTEALRTDGHTAYETALGGATRSSDLFDRLGGRPESVARTVVKAIEADRPRARYRIPRATGLLPPAAHLAPTQLRDFLSARVFGI